MQLLATLMFIGRLFAGGAVPSSAPPIPDSVDAETALAAFRGALGAINAGDRSRYLDTLDNWTCDNDPRFTDAPIRSAQQAEGLGTIRTQSNQTVVAESTERQVVLIDVGVWYTTDHHGAKEPDADHGAYEHLVVMRKDSDRWHLAARTPLLGQRCLNVAPSRPTTTYFDRCRDEHYQAKFRCEQTCKDDPSQCQSCIDSARCTLIACLRLDATEANCSEE